MIGFQAGLGLFLVVCCLLNGVRSEDPSECNPELLPRIRTKYFDEETFFGMELITTPEEFESWWKEEGVEEPKAPRSAVFGFYGDDECLEALKKNIAFQCAQLHTGPSYMDVLLVPVEILPETMVPADSSCGVGFIGGGCSLSDKGCIKFSPHDEIHDDLIVRHTMEWTATLSSAELGIKNHRSESVHFFWVQEGTEGKYTGELGPGQETVFKTSLSHAFYARASPLPNSQLIDYAVALQPRQMWIIEDDLPTEEDAEEFHDFLFQNWIGAREARNFLQSRVIQSVTKDGFKKVRFPTALFEEILGWYNERQANEEVETPVGPCLNQDVADTYMVHLSDKLKAKIGRELLPILEEWSNDKLEKTALYGIRRYTRNSVLEMHTDTAHTHAVSAIINMKQEGLEKDWPLEIYDHNNVLHEVVMQPGDMVLYESAKLLHGRTQPLQGEGYSNFFLHYRPTNLDRWDYLWM